MTTRIAHLPVNTWPEPLPDAAILAAADMAAALGCQLQATVHAMRVPAMPASPLGGLLLDVPGLARAAEDRSRTEAERLRSLLAGRPGVGVSVSEATMGEAVEAAALRARYFDLTVLPWAADTMAAQDMAAALVFGSGRPAILVPAGARPGAMDHAAVAWDESRVAARALGDALALLPPGGRVTVLTVQDEKALRDGGLAETLVAALALRGVAAAAAGIVLGGRTIAAALQEAAVAAGAGMLAMGGFGHSRLRDFVLGGATQGVLRDLRLPVLLSH